MSKEVTVYRVFSIKGNGYPILHCEGEDLATAKAFAIDLAANRRLVAINEAHKIEVRQVKTQVMLTVEVELRQSKF